MTLHNAKRLKHLHHLKVEEDYPFDKNDLTYENNQKIFNMVFMCFVSGVLGGIVGIAGGIILAPLFLYMGMLPSVVANTNQYLAMIQTISVTSQFMYLGMVNYEYSLILGFLIILGSLLGISQVNRLV